jgi:hypothetical protein
LSSLNDNAESLKIPQGFRVVLNEGCDYDDATSKTFHAEAANLDVTHLSTQGFAMDSLSSMLIQYIDNDDCNEGGCVKVY